jgi:hypothetical protein
VGSGRDICAFPDQADRQDPRILPYLASLDGYIADDRGNFNWAEPDEEVLDFINETEQNIGLTSTVGRSTR